MTWDEHEETLTLSNAGVSFDVQFDRYHGDRVQYAYRVRDGDEVLAQGNDLRSGSGSDIDLPDTLRSLMSFFLAFLESEEDGENGDLFPEECRAVDSILVEEMIIMTHHDSES